MKISIVALSFAGAFALSSCGEKENPPQKDASTGEVNKGSGEVKNDAGNSAVVSGITPETAVSKAFDGLAKVQVDGKYVDTQVRNADKYIVYFTASW